MKYYPFNALPMKKYFIGLALFVLIFAYAPLILARSESEENRVQSTVQTQNQGSSQRIQTELKEQESEGAEKEPTEKPEQQPSEKTEAAGQEQAKTASGAGEDAGFRIETKEHERNTLMEAVTKKMEDLKTVKLGQTQEQTQLQQLTQTQTQTQLLLKSQLDKITSRTGLAKFLIGPDFKAILAAKQELQQVQVRIEQLTKLQDKLTNEADQTVIKQTIQLLTDQQTYLQNELKNQENSFSFFGWFFKRISTI